eukprot:CAMPEP_0171468676 /NCGR_PEP_ID=MMETSP0945-20130129/10765_1 /TAXON_ID=109269 /ORGANISM="Vaucheria litorea, Strain CCMP2940" /LENGTH=188 /DNA_ID=CAMNT_0011997543 /DNA_START=102 /DNA_END=665 /DNA_ORIENTATION=+
MDVVIGLTGKDYVMCVADMSSNRSIFTLKRDEEKIAMVDEHKFLAAGGDQASRSTFVDYVSKNFALGALRTGLELSTHAAANFIRNELARAIRSRGGPHQANSLLGGVDEDGASLYHLDYLGSLEKVDFGAQGYCSYFSLALMDRHWKKNMTLEEGKELINLCIEQLKTRFIINNPRYRLIAVGKDGK